MRTSVWPVLVAATGGVTAGHWLMMAGILLGEGDADRGFSSVLVGAGLAAIAATVVASAVATGRRPQDGLIAIAAGSAVLSVVWLATSAEVPLPALAAGVGVAAALAVRRHPHHELWVRLMMVVVISGYVWWVTEFSAAFAIIVTPLLPYPTVGISDFASEREAKRRRRSGYAADEHD